MSYSTRKLNLKYGDYVLEIPNGNLGWCRKIMVAGLNQMEAMLSRTDRIFVIRIDCHAAAFSQTNKQISTFRRRLFKRLRRRFPDLLIAYLWVREMEKSKNQHYHFVIMVDADRVPAASVVLNAGVDVWEKLTGIHPHIPKNPYYLVKRGNKQGFQEAAKRMSYLAKSRGKGYRPDQTKDYGSSKLKAA
jgi:hypothetical protein